MLFFKKEKKIKSGFTLIEVLIASAIFAVVMLITSGAILSVFDANRKSQNLRSVMDNLNYSLESMTRSIRFGYNYHCDKTVTPTSSTRDCSGTPASSIVFLSDTGVEIIYDLTSSRIRRSVGGTVNYLTSTDITITRLNFYVIDSDPYCVTGCGTLNLGQPMVIVVVGGYVGTKPSVQSTFNLESTVSQRKIDVQ